jgi:anhydro-N-acetylmuramic acid kinase
MVYRAIGLMSGSSLDGLDIAFAEFHENAGKWTYEIKAAACSEYEPEWIDKLKQAIHLSALDYQLLHTAYGHYINLLRRIACNIKCSSLHHTGIQPFMCRQKK